MDQATAVKIAQNYGVPPTPQNINMIMQEAPNESALLGRSMGLQGSGSQEGYDDSILKSRLNKVADETLPKGRVEVGQPAVEGIAPPSTVNAPKAGPSTSALGPTKRTSGPNAGSRGDELGNDAASVGEGTDRSGGLSSPSDLSATQPPEGGVMPWIMALLGASSGAGRNATQPGVGGGGPPITSPPQITGPGNRNLIAGPGNVPQITYEPKLNAPANGATYPSGAIDNTAGPPAPDVAQPSASPTNVRKQPVRPEFNSTEMLQDALINFRKMFRK